MLTDSERELYLTEHVPEPETAQQLRRLLMAPVPEVTALFESGLVAVTQPLSLVGMIGRQLGVYEIDSLIGAGGMSNVYLANRKDGEYEQQVAIKVIPKHFFSQTQYLNIEAQVLSNLSHTNIAQVFDAGRVDDSHMYLVIQYIEGQTLDSYLSIHTLDLHQKLKLLLPIFEAIHHAHSRQVLHADIKPANIIVEPSGKPYLMDFGISRLLNKSADKQTKAYLKALSMDYGSPEQSEGESLTTASDVFSAGRLLNWIVDDESRKSEALASIIDKATQATPELRYSSMAQLVNDIEHYLIDKPVSVLSNPRYRLTLFIRRNRWVVSSSVAVSLIIVTLLLFGWQSYLESEHQKKQSALNLNVAQQILEQVDVVTGNEFDRQQQVIDAITKLNFDTLPDEQAAKLLLALAEAQLALGDYYEMANYAKQLYNLTTNSTPLLPYHLVAKKMLVEMHVHQIEYDETISGLNYIIDRLKQSTSLSHPIYQKILVWDIWVRDVTLLPFKLRMRELLEENGGLKAPPIDVQIHLKILEAEKAMFESNGKSIRGVLNEAWELAASPEVSLTLKLTMLAVKTEIESELFDLNAREWAEVEARFLELISLIKGAHPLKDHAIVILSLYEDNARMMQHRFTVEEGDINSNPVSVTPLIEFYFFQHQFDYSFEYFKLMPKLFKRLANKIDLRFVELSYDFLWPVFALYTEFGEPLPFETFFGKWHQDNAGELLKAFYQFDRCKNLVDRGLTSVTDCEDLPQKLRNKQELYSWHVSSKFKQIELLNSGSSKEVYNVLNETQALIGSTPYLGKENYFKNRLQRYWIAAELANGDIEMAQTKLESYLLKQLQPFDKINKRSLHILLLSVKLKLLKGDITNARYLMESQIDKYCKMIPGNYKFLRQLRILSISLPGDRIEICPDALKFSDVDPNNEVNAILDNAFESFIGYEPPLVN
ncbi:serine/threonine-protein kinase [uncultured Alteromonas sp.]|uniref:serine/threonine protein kinase n=1 Tax=uncultured Alteromonas sp. TaxID=179113 RepID=UPI0030CFE306|tara:strand:+ start:7898 stop:10717 length:2820 start_codon:yes stop_codon:yes gene_type:complete